MSHYIHGFSEAEQTRLAQMQKILNQYQLNVMNLSSVNSILDVGSGLGQMTRLMANHLRGNTKVVGVEKSEVQLGEARRLATEDGENNLVEFRHGEATQLPLADDEWNSFDFVHARFLLEHVPNPSAVVGQMVRALKPGGRIFLMDDDHDLLRVWPECPELKTVWQRYWESYRDLGHDPIIGRKMAQLLVDENVEIEMVSSLFYGAANGQALFDPVVDNLLGVIVGATELLEKSNRVSASEMQEFRSAMDQWRNLKSATIWYSLPYVVGVCK